MERMTTNRWNILKELHARAPEWTEARQLSELCGIPSGSIYPTLDIMTRGQVIESDFLAVPDQRRPIAVYRILPGGSAMVEARESGVLDEGAGWRSVLKETLDELNKPT